MKKGGWMGRLAQATLGAFLILGPAAQGSLASVQASWSPTGSLSVAHNGATATRLVDGGVLVVGGLGPDDASIATAEIYDPVAGDWSTTGSMNFPRTGHTATLLKDGRVLVTGGFDQPDCFPSCEVLMHQTAEIYDPSSGVWSPAGHMTSTRCQHTATLLKSGRILLAGGGCAGVLSTAEIYDPITGTWSATGSMASHRVLHTATLVKGRVLVTGGYGVSNTALDTAELYNPATGKWTVTGSMVTSRGHHLATRLLGSGKVLVVGGINEPGPLPPGFKGLAEAELYDPATGTWSATGSMTTPRFAHTLIRLKSGTVLVAGGEDEDTNVLQSSETYDPASGVWTAGPDMSTPRASATGTLLSNGQVIVASGFSINNPLTSAELYTP
ncbi:kelch repeat-containing protein [soil metagenome]